MKPEMQFHDMKIQFLPCKKSQLLRLSDKSDNTVREIIAVCSECLIEEHECTVWVRIQRLCVCYSSWYIQCTLAFNMLTCAHMSILAS